MASVNRCVAVTGRIVVSGLLALLVGCKSTSNEPVAAAPAVPPAKAEAPAQTPALPTIRIDAGSDAPYKDSDGNTWIADQGFDGGDTVTRAEDLKIANTRDPALYRTEHYGMASFSQALPDGKYIVKLHFAETFEDISGPAQRVFSLDVQGKKFEDFDVAAKAGAVQSAYVLKVPVDVTDGKLQITFTAGVQSPEINGIEIVPAP